MSFPTSTPKMTRKTNTTSTRTKDNDSASQGRKRRARFHNVVTITEIPSHRVYTFNERFAVWYTELEYRCFKLEESIRKLKTKNNKADISDRVQDQRYQGVPKARDVSQQHKRKYYNISKSNIIYDKHSAKITNNKMHESFSKVFEARQSTNRQLTQVQLQMHQQQQQQPLSVSTIQAKHNMMISSQIRPINFSSNEVPIQRSITPMTDPKSPVARGA